MKIQIYSDLHLEFGHGWTLPRSPSADILILAGDIICFDDFQPLEDFLQGWDKPVIYVPGNHEYYAGKPMGCCEAEFLAWAGKAIPQLTLLLDSNVTINGVHFFGGTMWTDFDNENPEAMGLAGSSMHDFRRVRRSDGETLSPASSVELHRQFVQKLAVWLQQNREGKRIVITHHAPDVDAGARLYQDALWPAYVATTLLSLISDFPPDLWVYGHVHECGDLQVGKTRLISNPRGYPNGLGGYENVDFHPCGRIIDL